MTDTYTFDNSDAHTLEQLDSIQRFLDPLTTARIEALDLPKDARCLELGPGFGSIAYWLAERVAPHGGSVAAVDLDTSRLRETPGLSVHQADVREGLPVEGPFDLIHARLVLLHLPLRREVLRRLVDVLAPGGWLVLGEFGEQPLRVHRAPSEADEALFAEVTRGLLDVIASHGGDMGWAHEAYGAMCDAGLTGVYATEHGESWTGGGTGARLYRVNVQQKRDEILARGFTPEQLDRYVELMGDPAFTAASYRFTQIAGRRPEAV